MELQNIRGTESAYEAVPGADRERAAAHTVAEMGRASQDCAVGASSAEPPVQSQHLHHYGLYW